jgi:hypothetical protein
MWLLFIGVSVVFSSLFTKAYRINLIMRNSKKFRRVTITVAQTLRPMIALLLRTLLDWRETLLDTKSPDT